MSVAASAPRLAPPKPWQRNATFGIIAATIVLGSIGDAVSGLLLGRHPLTMILLNAKPRYLVLTVNDLDAWTYYTVGTARLLCTKPLVWLIGAWYGDRAVGWAERRSQRGAGLIRWIERHFGRFGWAVIAITSNNVVCLLAGSAGFSLAWFMVLAVAGTLVRLWIFARVGDVFSTYIADVVSFIGDHRAPIVALSITVVLGGLWWQHRAGRSSLDDLASLEDAVDGGPRTDG